MAVRAARAAARPASATALTYAFEDPQAARFLAGVAAVCAASGWDDTDAAEPAGLTTVRQSLHDQGAECARIALGRPPQAGAPKWRVIRRASTRRR